jgi:hypothetical protein
MKRIFFLLLLAVVPALAQPPIGPTNEPVGARRGEDWNGFNLTNSWELGYRWRTAAGDLGKYRSDVNFGNGVRLLSNSFGLHSKNGQGKWLDELVFNTQGLGNDPYQFSSFRLQKNRLYRYDGLWRENQFFNPGLAIARGQHFMDTTRRLQDHDLTLLPQSRFRLFLGYSRNAQNGPALSTFNFNEHRGDEFTLFSNVRRQQNEYRLGGEARLAGFRLNVLRGWENFKEDTPYAASASPGANVSDATTLTRANRVEPYHGNSPYWRVGLFRDAAKRFTAAGRFTYTAGRRNFVQDDTVIGEAARLGTFNRQIVTFGNARRPVATGNLTLSWMPTGTLTVTNHTAFYNIRMDGSSFFRQFDNATLADQLLNFDFLGIRTATNITEANWQIHRVVGVFGGFQYADRRIRSVQGFQFPGTASQAERADQSNAVKTGTFGLRLRPVKPLTLQLSGELGRADQPIYPTSERNYHVLNARVLYKLKNVTLSAQTKANYNFNANALTAFQSRARSHAVDGSWTPNANFSLQGGFQRLHLDTLAGVAYFVANFTQVSSRYRYLSQVNSGYFTTRVAIKNRADLFVGLNAMADTADAPVARTPADFLLTAQAFPLAFRSPMARLSLRIHQRLRWNAGYQYYGYRQDFESVIIPRQSYRAHTGYTSLSWSF